MLDLLSLYLIRHRHFLRQHENLLIETLDRGTNNFQRTTLFSVYRPLRETQVLPVTKKRSGQSVALRMPTRGVIEIFSGVQPSSKKKSLPVVAVSSAPFSPARVIAIAAHNLPGPDASIRMAASFASPRLRRIAATPCSGSSPRNRTQPAVRSGWQETFKQKCIP